MKGSFAATVLRHGFIISQEAFRRAGLSNRRVSRSPLALTPYVPTGLAFSGDHKSSIVVNHSYPSPHVRDRLTSGADE